MRALVSVLSLFVLYIVAYSRTVFVLFYIEIHKSLAARILYGKFLKLHIMKIFVP